MKFRDPRIAGGISVPIVTFRAMVLEVRDECILVRNPDRHGREWFLSIYEPLDDWTVHGARCLWKYEAPWIKAGGVYEFSVRMFPHYRDNILVIDAFYEGVKQIMEGIDEKIKQEAREQITKWIEEGENEK